MRKQFRFIRWFTQVRSIYNMVHKLCDTWFCYYKVLACSPRFTHNDHNTSQLILMSQVEKQWTLVNLYASVDRGSLFDKQAKKLLEEFIKLQFKDCVVENRKHACLDKVRDFLTLPNLQILCLDEWRFDMQEAYGFCFNQV